MKIEITIPTPSTKSLKALTLGLFVVLAGVLLWQRGLSAFLLFLAFCLLLLAIGLAWASVTTFSDRERLTLDEALDVAAPARDEERKLAVLRGIKDLEYERSLGKISEQDYAELMLRYRSDAKALLQKLDTSEASLRQRALERAKAKLGESQSSKPEPESHSPAPDQASSARADDKPSATSQSAATPAHVSPAHADELDKASATSHSPAPDQASSARADDKPSATSQSAATPAQPSTTGTDALSSTQGKTE